MSSGPSRCSDAVKRIVLEHGACRAAIAAVGLVDDGARRLYDRWLEAGGHASMRYLEKYSDVRSNPAMLLPGARSMVCCAFAYRPAPKGMGVRIAAYALGTDYHIAIRERLEGAAARLREIYGGETRVCVDTAPLRERYWGVRSGLGVQGVNNHLIVPGVGSYVLLGEILTTVEFEPDAPIEGDCGGCGRCVRSCPTGALRPDGSVDGGRCLSYLTIEHRGDFAPGTDLHGCLYGCDSCAAVCPHNAGASKAEVVPELLPRPELLGLTARRCREMTQEEFSVLFRKSAIKRTKLGGLVRNAAHLGEEKQ